MVDCRPKPRDVKADHRKAIETAIGLRRDAGLAATSHLLRQLAELDAKEGAFTAVPAFESAAAESLPEAAVLTTVEPRKPGRPRKVLRVNDTAAGS